MAYFQGCAHESHNADMDTLSSSTGTPATSKRTTSWSRRLRTRLKYAICIFVLFLAARASGIVAQEGADVATDFLSQYLGQSAHFLHSAASGFVDLIGEAAEGLSSSRTLPFFPPPVSTSAAFQRGQKGSSTADNGPEQLYDYIVVGCGAAGCPLARTLADDGKFLSIGATL